MLDPVSPTDGMSPPSHVLTQPLTAACESTKKMNGLDQSPENSIGK